MLLPEGYIRVGSGCNRRYYPTYYGGTPPNKATIKEYRKERHLSRYEINKKLKIEYAQRAKSLKLGIGSKFYNSKEYVEHITRMRKRRYAWGYYVITRSDLRFLNVIKSSISK
jgi:hypothetical protein